MMFLPKRILVKKMRKFLEEDVGQGDITTSLVVPPETVVEAEIIAKESGIIAGLEEALAFLELFEQTGDLLPGEDRPILADVLISYIAPGALTQTTLHLTLKGGHDLTVGEAQIL